MNIRALSLPALGLLSALSLPAFAVDKDGAYAPKGVGLLSCEQVLKAAEKEDEKLKVATALANWLDGYVTAQNLGLGSTYDVASWTSTPFMVELIGSQCSKVPQARIAQVAQELMGFLGPTRLQAKSEVVEIKEGDKKGLIYAETLKRAQQTLKDGGHLNATPDGKWGSKTKDGFKAFQKKEGLQETGLPDSLTLLRLFAANGKGGEAKTKQQ